jgi:hypothetical protein
VNGSLVLGNRSAAVFFLGCEARHPRAGRMFGARRADPSRRRTRTRR